MVVKILTKQVKIIHEIPLEWILFYGSHMKIEFDV